MGEKLIAYLINLLSKVVIDDQPLNDKGKIKAEDMARRIWYLGH